MVVPASLSTSGAIVTAIQRHERLVHELQTALDVQVKLLDQLTRQLPTTGDSSASLPRQRSPQHTATTEHTATAQLVARLLGSFEIQLGGGSVDTWRSQKAASLLKYLLLQEAHSARRDVLMDVFWPRSSPKSARNNLNVTVYQLRSTLRGYDPSRTHVVYRVGSYRLDHQLTLWTDVDEYTQAVHLGHQCSERGDTVAALTAYRHAHALYRGELLEDDTSGEWFFDMQRRLRLDHFTLLERLGVLLLEHGDLNQSAVMGEDLVAADPCRETGYQLLMRTYAALGQPQLVVNQYRRCVDVLRRELAVGPDQSTTSLFASLVPAAVWP
ncbi:MAG: BTAD domain-containing putative transcriptional regulator [Nocardioidaceae bacterium]